MPTPLSIDLRIRVLAAVAQVGVTVRSASGSG